jgi:hypothetical protein
MALLVLTFMNLWCAYHYYRAGRTLRDDQIAVHGVSPVANAA